MDNSYRNIFKSNFAFGGVKFFQILIQVLRTKLFAIFLGPAGMGFQSLLVSTLNTIHEFSTFGIFKASVKDISIANSTNITKIDSVIRVLNIWTVIFAFLGFSICIIGSKWLSYLMFGNYNYSWAFVVVSFALLFESLTNEIIAIFQGLRQVKQLATTSLLAALLSLIIVLPVICIWRLAGVPYAVVISYLVFFSVYYISYNKSVKKSLLFFSISTKEMKETGGSMVRNGFLLMLSYCIYTVITLLTGATISRLTDMETVGYYNAANACTYGNIMIFASIIASDFYPRMSALVNNREEFSETYNKQVELMVLSLLPVITLVLIFSKYIVIILYSKEFLIIVPYVRIMAISLLLRIVWQVCSVTFMAIGKNGLYLLVDAIIGNGLFFIITMTSFYYWGLAGLSYAFVVSSFIIMCFLIMAVKIIAKSKLDNRIICIIGVGFLMLLTLYVSLSYLYDIFQIIVSGIISCVIIVTSLKLLNSKINYLEYIKKTIHK